MLVVVGYSAVGGVSVMMAYGDGEAGFYFGQGQDGGKRAKRMKRTERV